MVLLYVLVSDICPISESILQYVEKSLQIYGSMKVLAVARRCAEITKELLAVVKRIHRERGEQQGQSGITSSAARLLPDSNNIGHSEDPVAGGHAEDISFPMETSMIVWWIRTWCSTSFALRIGTLGLKLAST